MSALPGVILLMGPTASGKTALGIELAKVLDGEVISVDSALVYRGMDIGTAKPDIEEQDGIKHHLIDTLDPSEVFSAGQFREKALALIDDIIQRGKVPILVGGTMLYFHVLLNGMAKLPDANAQIRQQINEQAQAEGWVAVHQRLQEVDPVAAKRIHENDTQRTQRALEIYLVSGRSQTEWLAEQSNQTLPFEPFQFAIAPSDRAELHVKIALRFDLMLKNGFMDEVKVLFNRGDLDDSMPAIRAVGYRQAWAYLENKYDADTFREKAIIATRQLAKRQFTWLRQQTKATWLETGDKTALDQVIAQFTAKVAE
ncbi:MAG: tRNA (adenosine(37)-N6)-dimethylallyltransferase MiaA [Cycloclasticus sp. symbiont of Bathymodiolus heckerae]|nr:MAG: tRNA (adenosine(37)-N6)-dimethylallyltransferase MiaA [Cycloclasticus sp. symbiont of Bathymodiolus heckerae]